MLIEKLTIHNYRSIKHQEFNLKNLSILVGRNNSGKSNLIDAILTLFLKKKFIPEKDIYKDGLSDERDINTWISIVFRLNKDKSICLNKEENPCSSFNILKDRLELIVVLNGKKKIHGYTLESRNGPCLISNKRVISIWNKLELYVDIVYIPSSLDVLYDNFIREEVNKETKIFTFSNFFSKIKKEDKDLIINSPSKIIFEKIVYLIVISLHYGNFKSDLERQNKKNTFKASNYIDSGKTFFSYEKLTKDLNSQLDGWDIYVKIFPNSHDGTSIQNELPSYFPIINFFDIKTHTKINPNFFGKGFQRFFIFLLLKILSENWIHKNDSKNDVNYLKLIVFEEPENHIDLTQIYKLNFYFEKFLSRSKFCNQILITTHSLFFLSRQKDNYNGLIQLNNYKGYTEIFQFKEIDKVLKKASNIKFNEYVLNYIKKLKATDKENKKIINFIEKHKKWANKNEAKNEEIVNIEKLNFENLFTANLEITNLFFANHVIICEGFTEKILLDYCILKVKGWEFFWKQGIYILNAMGSHNIPSYSSLLRDIGISYTIMLDNDKNSSNNPTIKASKLLINFLKKEFPKIEILEIEDNIESHLFGEEYDKKNKNHSKKPQFLLKRVKEIFEKEENQSIKKQFKLKLNELKRKLFFLWLILL